MKKLLTAIAMILFFVTSIFAYFKYLDYAEEKFMIGQEFEGIITKKHKDTTTRSFSYIEIEGYKRAFILTDVNYYNLVQPGDYIFKKKNSLRYILVKDNDTIFLGIH